MSSRRDFLKTLGGMALLTVVPRSVLGGPKYVAPSDQLTKGIIGVGGMDLISGVGGERSYGTISEMTSPYAAMVDLLGEDRVDGAVGIDKFLYLATVRKSRICSVSILVLPPIDTGTRTDPRTASPGGRPCAASQKIQRIFWLAA